MFTDEQLKKLVFPLVIEQMLAMTMGLVDTMMVASCGEAAVLLNRLVNKSRKPIKKENCSVSTIEAERRPNPHVT